MFFFLPFLCGPFNAKSTGSNIKVEEPLGGLKSNLQLVGYLPHGKHLVAIFLQSSPSIPGQDHSRIYTGPEEKYNISKIKK